MKDFITIFSVWFVLILICLIIIPFLLLACGVCVIRGKWKELIIGMQSMYKKYKFDSNTKHLSGFNKIERN